MKRKSVYCLLNYGQRKIEFRTESLVLKRFCFAISPIKYIYVRLWFIFSVLSNRREFLLEYFVVFCGIYVYLDAIWYDNLYMFFVASFNLIVC